MDTPNKSTHIGKQIRRMRELRGIKQETLAEAIGVSQQTISTIENSETVDEVKLSEVARALGVSAEAIKNFSEEGVINYFSFYDNSSSQGPFGTMNCSFNPIDKVVELYERLLKSEQEKNMK